MKKKNIIVISFVILLILIICGILYVSRNFNVDKKEDTIISLTKEFYGYYYTEIEKTSDVQKYLTQFKETGLKISLGDIEVYLDGKKGKEGDYSVLDKCDVDKTYSKIYPKSPYSKDDIEVKVILSCKE